MATINDFGGNRLDGTTKSNSSNSEYQVQTDGNGTINCSCIGWLNDSKMRKGEKRAIKDRWCSHLTQLKLEYDQHGGKMPSLKARPNVQVIERTVVKEVRVGGPDPVTIIRAELTAAEAAVNQARAKANPAALKLALAEFKRVREKALTTNDVLAEQAEEIKAKLAKLTGAMEEAL